MARASDEPFTLLVVSGGRSSLPVIAAARELGLRVLVSDGAPDAPGFRVADAGLVAGVCDVEATVAAVRAYRTLNRVDGVIGVGAEATATVDAVVAAMGRPETVPLGDRLVAAARLRAAGVPVAWSAGVDDARMLARLAASADGALLLRPARAGDAATVRLTGEVSPSSAFAIAEAMASGGRLMVEREGDGRRVHGLALLDGEGVAAVFFADRCAEARGAVLGTGGLDFPSRWAGRESAELVAQAVAALAVREGIVEVDLVLTPTGPLLAGIAACLSHVYFAAHQLPLATGQLVLHDALRLTLGQHAPRVARDRPRGTAFRYLRAPAGVVTRVAGVERAVAGGVRCEVHLAPGDRVAAFAPEPAGFVLADGATLDDAVARAEASAACIRVLTVSREQRPAALFH